MDLEKEIAEREKRCDWRIAVETSTRPAGWRCWKCGDRQLLLCVELVRRECPLEKSNVDPQIPEKLPIQESGTYHEHIVTDQDYRLKINEIIDFLQRKESNDAD